MKILVDEMPVNNTECLFSRALNGDRIQVTDYHVCGFNNHRCWLGDEDDFKCPYLFKGLILQKYKTKS